MTNRKIWRRRKRKTARWPFCLHSCPWHRSTLPKNPKPSSNILICQNTVHGARFMESLIFFCRSTAFVRFDPTSKEHTKSYEKPREESKPAAEKTKKGDKSKKNKEQVNFWSVDIQKSIHFMSNFVQNFVYRLMNGYKFLCPKFHPTDTTRPLRS